jgi:Ca2+-binding RTX toxin-like protein
MTKWKNRFETAATIFQEIVSVSKSPSYHGGSDVASMEIGVGTVLDTHGLKTLLSNLDMKGGTIRSSVGALSIKVNDNRDIAIFQDGTIEGTVQDDRLVVNVANNFDLSGLTFANWSAGIDLILMIGSDGDNRLVGSRTNDIINGIGGNDEIWGIGGIDTIDGGGGDDWIGLFDVNTGSSVFGGDGIDCLAVFGPDVRLGAVSGFEAISGDGAIWLSGEQYLNGFAADTVVSGRAQVVIKLAAGEHFSARNMTDIGGGFAQLFVYGKDGDEIIKGGMGIANSIHGYGGADTIRGGNLSDFVMAGDGDDVIIGLGGADRVAGGNGTDWFVYRNATDAPMGIEIDQIFDFVSGVDKLDFRTLDTDPDRDGIQPLTYIGTSDFENTGIGQIRWVNSGRDLHVEADTDGNGVADMQILLTGAGTQTLIGSDFLL